LNKFITPVAVVQPTYKMNNSVFHLQNQARPLHSNNHTNLHNFCYNWTSWYFKYTCCFIFINCLIQRDATWQKTKTRYSVITNS